MSSKRCFSMDGNSPYWPKPALLISSSISIPFCLVTANMSSGAFGLVKSAGNTSVLILCVDLSLRANSSRRSLRRAVSARFVPRDANSSARATPIPALAPVTSAHFPDHSPAFDDVLLRDNSPSARNGSLFLLLLRTQHSFLKAQALALHPVHQAARPDKFCREQTHPEKNHQHAGAGSNEHNHTGQEQGETSDDEENSAYLLNRAEDHAPLLDQLSGGEGGILTQPPSASYHV